MNNDSNIDRLIENELVMNMNNLSAAMSRCGVSTQGVIDAFDAVMYESYYSGLNCVSNIDEKIEETQELNKFLSGFKIINEQEVC